MHTTGMSFKMGYHYTVIHRLLRKHTQTNNVKDLPRSGRPRVTFDRDDRALQRLVRCMPFVTSPVLKQHWLPNRRLSARTVRNGLKSAGLMSRKVIKRPLLVDDIDKYDIIWFFIRFLVLSATFNNISTTRRDPPTMGKQLVNFITSGWESSALFL